VDPWPKKLSAITLFTEDFAATKRFYAEVFGVRQIFEDPSSVVFDFGNTLINLLDATAVPELIEPATIGDPAGGPRAVMTLDVDDVDVVCAELAKRGVALLNGPMDRPWGPRTASFRDPAGHTWEIAGPAQPAG
jgi:lactoylglutathione lyase